MSVVVNVRGTNGSGKSTLVRRLISCCEVEILRGFFGVEGYHLKDINTYVVGDYETGDCGGCDRISSQDQIRSMIAGYAERGNVVFEGAIMTTCYNPWLKFSREVIKGGMTWAFLDTPLEVCLQRVRDRRVSKGKDTVFNEQYLIDKWKANRRIESHAQEAGENVVILPYQDPFPVLSGLFTSEKLQVREKKKVNRLL